MSGCAKGKVLKTYVVRAAMFANWHSSKLGSNPGTKFEGHPDLYDYLSNGWLPGF